MNGTDKRWNIKGPSPGLSQKISRSLNISPLVSQLLINRGLDTPELISSFLSANLRDLHSPFLMKDMQKAVDRIITAINRNEKISVFGDYDVDGITSTALMVLFLKELKSDVSFYIPDRVSEGYSLNINALKKIKRGGITLIITVDCGVSDFKAISFANSQGLDVIVTDHHVTPEALAPAYAILNPKQPGCRFPFKGLAGVGVAFNLVMALRKALREKGFWQHSREPNLKEYLDLVALGTIADVAPVLDENRIFVKSGLGILSEGKRPGIKALKLVSGIPEGVVMANLVAYRLAPRLNAPGRLSDAALSVQVLLATEFEDAFAMAKKIDEANTRRQQVERKILSEARKMIKKENNLSESIILFSPAWHQGLVGLCASRLSDEFYRPAILISINEKKGDGRGSARSIQGFDLYKALQKCSSFLSAFGGHMSAAGLTVPVGNLDPFIEKFNDIVKQELMPEDFIPSINVDAEISLGQLSCKVLEEIEALSPFGSANPEPVFSSNEIKFFSSMVVGNGHLKLKIKEDGRFFDAIGFNMASRYSMKHEKIRLAFVPQFNFFNGEKIIQLNLKDIKECAGD